MPRTNNRAKIILLQDDKIALLERHRDGLHYYVFPGGHIEQGETPEQGAIRETLEELGLQVGIRRLVAQGEWDGAMHYYFLVDVLGGIFGSGTGEEWTEDRPGKGTYAALWMPLTELLEHPVKPFSLAEAVVRCAREGWPEQPIVVTG